MGVETALIVGGAAAAAGAGAGAVEGRRARKKAEGRADAEEQRQQAETARRDANISKVREQYGIGGTATAQTNQRTLADALREVYQANLSSGLREADEGFSRTSRTNRQNLARVGQLGSGLDANAQAGTLSDYLKARRQAASQATGARDRLQANLDSQRLGFESQISGGTMANPDFGSIAAQRQGTISDAQSQIPSQAIGSLFKTAGNTYFEGRQQEAQGNQGMQAFGFSSSTNRGRIS